MKQGGTIATLEIPELQEDLKQAQAGVDAADEAVKQADANYQGVHLDFTRLQQVVQGANPSSSPRRNSTMPAPRTSPPPRAWPMPNSGSARRRPNRNARSAMVDYSKITAPFDGVVTKRYADVGRMIQAGTSSSVAGTAVVRFAQENVLRVMFPVPESAVASVKNGVPVKIEVSGLHRTLDGNVTRFARQLNPETRTMETEVDIPNDDLSITPGMFGWAELTLEEHKDVLSVPVEAISAGENPSVYLIDKDNKIEDRPVKIGMETPNRVEITGGCNPANSCSSATAARSTSVRSVQPKVIETAQIAYKANNG